jgi:uncharacterized protein YxjI
MTSPANWYPDPMGRHQVRYWDGTVWTDHVADNGVAATDPVHGGGAPAGKPATTVDTRTTAADVARQVQGTGWSGAGIAGAAGGALASGGGGTIFTEPILVVNQKAKLIELTNQYAVFDQHGRQIASVNEVGQNAAKKVLRALTSVDQFMTHRLEIHDGAGGVLLRLTRPAKVFKSTVVVGDGPGNEIGRIVQENVFGKIRFDLQAGGTTIGSIKAENWRAWNFRITDTAGTEVARITKTWEGLAKQMFTTADNYVVQLHYTLPSPLLQLVVASALSVDTALKQDSRGLG